MRTLVGTLAGLMIAFAIVSTVAGRADRSELHAR